MKNKLLLIVLILLSVYIFLEYLNVKKTEINFSENLNSINDVKIEELNLFEKKCLNVKDKLNKEKCLEEYFENYASLNGPELSYKRLDNLKKVYKESPIECHYISHSIGHGVLKFYKNNYLTAFNVVSEGEFLKNINTCGNGYFHGIMEQVAKGVKDKESLVKLFQNLCNGVGVDDKNCLNFYKYHGIGHASLVQLENYQDALYVCDNIADADVNKFGCYTGVFMEKSKKNDGQVNVKNGMVSYDFCNSLDEKYISACYLEQSIFVKDFISKEDTNNPIDYCKQISDSLNRLACVKYFVIDSLVSNTNDLKIQDICLNTTTNEEKRICLAILASKISLSLDKNKSEIYYKSVDRICSSLNFLDKLHCKAYIFRYPERLFFVSDDDLKEIKIFEIIKYVFR